MPPAMPLSPTIHGSRSGRACLVWRPSCAGWPTDAATGEWQSTVWPAPWQADRLGAYALVARRRAREYPRSQSVNREYASRSLRFACLALMMRTASFSRYDLESGRLHFLFTQTTFSTLLFQPGPGFATLHSQIQKLEIPWPCLERERRHYSPPHSVSHTSHVHLC